MDIVQETFFKAYENLKSFDADRNFVTWLFTIGKNNAYNYMKTRKRNMLHQVSGGLENLDGMTSGSFEPEKEAVRNSERARLIDAVASLPEKYKMLIYLKYIEGLSYKEIGDRLKLTESLVESRVFTARRKLAAFIKEGE
jgi:RNA polymerase sigma-70 factor (ECF subfamily)